jgi:hypothetical protein
MKYLLIISTCLGLASCSRGPVIHEIHYVPSHGYTLPPNEVKTTCNHDNGPTAPPYRPYKEDRRTGPYMPLRTKKDDTKAYISYNNQRQYPNRHGKGLADSED